MREDADRLDREGDRVTAEATAVAREGELLLPRLDLCTKVVANYRIKIDAARHKESLLENMSLEEMRTGLFGTTENSPLLSKDLMKVSHLELIFSVVINHFFLGLGAAQLTLADQKSCPKGRTDAGSVSGPTASLRASECRRRHRLVFRGPTASDWQQAVLFSFVPDR